MLSRALVLAAHGSHYNMRSSEPARRFAANLARQGQFEQVVCAFWKEFPALRDVHLLVDACEVVVVPLFMAEGYFSQRVVPRELELDGPVTRRGETTWYYTTAIGAEPRLHEVIRERALAALAGALEPAQVHLMVVGHGTVQNRNSKGTVLEHVERLRGDGFGAVSAAFLEEPPLVTEIPALTAGWPTVVVPLFVADGLHTAEDIPRDLGLARGEHGYESPTVVDGRPLWCTGAVGNDPAMESLILALAARALGEEVA